MGQAGIDAKYPHFCLHVFSIPNICSAARRAQEEVKIP